MSEIPSTAPDTAIVDELLARARLAQADFEKGADQNRYDRASLAAG